MEICKNCRRLFDSEIVGQRFADTLLCSWHPGVTTNVGNLSGDGDYAERWKWSCCGAHVIGPIVSMMVNGRTEIRDYPPPRSPGCKEGPHEADKTLRIADPKLAEELASLQQRLIEIEAFETTGMADSLVFISYSHGDKEFVDQIATQLSRDRVNFWRDEKDILVGDVIDRAISEGIQKSSLFLLVLTPSSINSHWVARELDEAAHEVVESRKIVLPLVAKGLTLDDIPARVRRFKCADFNKDFGSSYSELHRSIKLHFSRHAPEVK